MQRTFQTGKSEKFEFWGRRKNGEIFPKEVICNRGKYFGEEVLISTARDITERKQAEQALRESEEIALHSCNGNGALPALPSISIAFIWTCIHKCLFFKREWMRSLVWLVSLINSYFDLTVCIQREFIFGVFNLFIIFIWFYSYCVIFDSIVLFSLKRLIYIFIVSLIETWND